MLSGRPWAMPSMRSASRALRLPSSMFGEPFNGQPVDDADAHRVRR